MATVRQLLDKPAAYARLHLGIPILQAKPFRPPSIRSILGNLGLATLVKSFGREISEQSGAVVNFVDRDWRADEALPRRWGSKPFEAGMRRLMIGLLILAVLPYLTVADDVVKLVTFPRLRPGAINPYDLALLHEALERTRRDYGAYEVQPFTEDVSVGRAIELAVEGRLVNVLSAGVGQSAPSPEQEMIPVAFPIDKGLLGYRVAFIDRRSQDRLTQVHSIEELRQLRIGQGSGWGDVRIYEHEGIPVETTYDYESLVLMLLHGRFDLFPRGLWEVAPELAAYGTRYPDLAVEQHLLIHYPFFEAFYVSRTAPRLASRLSTGLDRMVADGSFDTFFARHYRKLLADLNLRQRVVIELENPFLPAWVPLKRKELWFDPARLP